MIKEKLIEEIKSFIFSRDDIEYKTVRWGWCTDANRIEKYCKKFREAGVPLGFTCDRGNAEYPSRNFRFTIERYNEGMIEKARRIMREIEAEKKK